MAPPSSRDTYCILTAVKYLVEKSYRREGLFKAHSVEGTAIRTGKARQRSWQPENVAETPHMAQTQKVRA